ncbi:hypothetical protein [Marinobacterium stanieri]|uniref:CARDB domain-containing protein n=1 Tax=Marinobacterium stanieri TaxID=49186 RepID=A0A1N6Q2Z4_9GAMM|nr:hypothetical protein [Marinobacterium stanieri]SIQ10948.1 hypothetical protein SAMN05421647_102217 [Marinobacterium stanieri]
MAAGKLGAAVPPAEVDTTVYTVPAETVTTLNISVVNRGVDASVLSVAITTNEVPADEDFIEYGLSIPASGVFERTALVAGPGENIIVQASTGSCSVRIFGFEEVA